MKPILRVGMGQPYAVRVTVASSTDFDPSVVTAATFEVTKGDGAHTTWSATITAQSVDAITVVHALDSTELDVTGTWRTWVQFTVPAQTPGPRSEPLSFAVKAADSP